MRFFLRKEPKGSIYIYIERQANNIYSVNVHGSGVIVPSEMEKDIINMVSKYVNGYGYEKTTQ